MKIFPDVGRIVCANVIEVDPVRYAHTFMSYVEVQDGLIRTQRRPDSEWKDDTYRIQGDLIFWNHGHGKGWPWQLIPEDKLPGWFQSCEEGWTFTESAMVLKHRGGVRF